MRLLKTTLALFVLNGLAYAGGKTCPEGQEYQSELGVCVKKTPAKPHTPRK